MPPHDPPSSVFHEGELAVQALAGERAIAARNGQVIGPTIMPAAWGFLADCRILAVSAVADDGAVWCSVWWGPPGFATTPDGTTVVVATAGDGAPVGGPDDPVRPLVRRGGGLGLLAIDPTTRRRLRINGVVTAATDDAVTVAVHESFPNCTKYVQQRQWSPRPAPVAPRETARGTSLDPTRIDRVQRSDTMFVGSLHPTRGLDASHRGGEPGFVVPIDGHGLWIPDYRGNGMFNTLGNLHVDPRVGVAFVDFERGRLLAVTGRGVSTHGPPPRDGAAALTGRAWRLDVARWVEIDAPAARRWRLVGRSPHNPPATAMGV